MSSIGTLRWGRSYEEAHFVAAAVPANAGSVSWTTVTSDCVASTCCGAKDYGYWYGAYTTHLGWANLGVRGKFNEYGVWCYTATSVDSNVATTYSAHWVTYNKHWW